MKNLLFQRLLLVLFRFVLLIFVLVLCTFDRFHFELNFSPIHHHFPPIFAKVPGALQTRGFVIIVLYYYKTKGTPLSSVLYK